MSNPRSSRPSGGHPEESRRGANAAARLAVQMRDRVAELLRQAGVQAGETVVVAVSGGLDSMVLLDILDHLSGRLSIQLHVAHFDHRLRPESADDVRLVAQEAQARGLPCTCGGADVGTAARRLGLSVEEAGRKLRYQFLDEVALEAASQRIALGHHAGDQAETLLLRLVRGSGSHGLGAMELARQGRYLRPLLGFERSRLAAYAEARGIEWREDPSNRDLQFLRNRVRHELIPYLRLHFNPNLVQVLGRTARVLKDEDQHLEHIAQAALGTVICERSPGKITLAAPRLLEYHIAIQRRIVRSLLEGHSPGEGPLGFAQVEKVLEQAREADSGVFHLYSGWRGQRAGERLLLRRGSAAPVDVEPTIPGQTRIPERGLTLHLQLRPASGFADLLPALGGYRAALDAQQAGTPMRLRSARPGDRFQPLGMCGHKKLSDLLIDSKWPRILRDEVLVLDCGGQIAWVAGLRPGHPFRVREATRQILLIELHCETA